ncbi:DivIVA domain-containing protein [Aquirufa sp. OSTEICH-129V]|uniref:DivIVA domain-containing protein n=1 Tax=Aquirufa avitistagni TaxID=3104728 RepID=A0ABW6D9H7_9BACT
MSISAVSFSKGFRGYDVAEVQAYVNSVDQFAAESARNEQLMQEKIQQLEQEVNRLREVESSLFRAMKLAEEAQVHWQQKVEKEAEGILADAKKKANALIAESEQSVKKAALLVENERKQLLAHSEQELKEKQREMGRLEAVQQAFAEQMLELSQQTIDQLAKWKKDVPPVAPVKSEQVKAKSASKMVKPVVKPKPVAKKKAKPVSKPAKSNHLDVTTIEDDGLPTLNKVLEAYAKSSGPRGKVGDLN